MEVKTNHNWREFTYRWDVPSDVLEGQFDWMKETDSDTGEKSWPEDSCTDGFFCYKGHWYHLSDFMRTEAFPSWDGVSHDSFFSGVVIRLSEDGERFQVGTWTTQSQL